MILSGLGGPRSDEVASRTNECDGAADMIRRILFVLLALTALAAPARAKDELVIGMTQSPGTWNPLISSMLAKSLVSNMTSRPLNLCTSRPTS